MTPDGQDPDQMHQSLGYGVGTVGLAPAHVQQGGIGVAGHDGGMGGKMMDPTHTTHLGPGHHLPLANPHTPTTIHPVSGQTHTPHALAHSPLPSGHLALHPTTSAPSSTMIYSTPLPAVSPPITGQPQHHNTCPPPELHSMQHPHQPRAGAPPPPPPTHDHQYYESTPVPPMHLSLPEHRPPPMSLPMPPTQLYDESGQYISPGYNNTHATPGQLSPYQPSPLSAGPHSASSGPMTEYFPPYQSTPLQSAHHYQQAPTPLYPVSALPLISPPIQYGAAYGVPSKAGPSRSNMAKTGRQQFSACGACRHRRVKCDLREKQEKMQKESTSSELAKAEAKKRGKRAVCSNCEERGIACIDEYAPLKAAKQLRRGKRISEIEVIYGKPAAEVAQLGGDVTEAEEPIPELSREFFESAFFRRFQVQRPILDPQNFIQRYLAAKEPNAASMGPEGAVLCHVLYAWALSYGVDHRGELDIPEGGGESLGVLSVVSPGPNEMRREADRQTRFEQMRKVIEIALREIDEIGIMRKPTWDGVRVLLLILPLTEGIASQVERLAMYETALSQVYALCSFGGMGYDGLPSGTSSVNGGRDVDGMTNVQLVRVRIYWYAFVHEGITTGLKGGRLHLDEEDLETMQDSINNRSVVISSTSAFNTTVKFATAPIHLALACRLIHRALTGPAARRKAHVNPEHLKEAWEALERSWEEFEALKNEPASGQIYKSSEDVVRFADGWKIFLFEAQSVIRRVLGERLELALQRHAGSQIVDGSTPEENVELVKLRHLVDIAKSKCEVKVRQILTMVRRHVGTRFFEWDASLVRDGTFYAAKMMPGLGMGEEDMGYCLQALNELRWAHAKAFERSTELRKVWVETRHGTPCSVPSIDLPGPTDGTPMHTSQSLPTLQMTSLHLRPLDPNDSFPGSALSGDSNPVSGPSRSASPIYSKGEVISPTGDYPSGYAIQPQQPVQYQQQQQYSMNQQHMQSHSVTHTPVHQYTHLPPNDESNPHTGQGSSSPYGQYSMGYVAGPDQDQYQPQTHMQTPYTQHHPLPPHEHAPLPQVYMQHPSHDPAPLPRTVAQQHLPPGYTQSHMLPTHAQTHLQSQSSHLLDQGPPQLQTHAQPQGYAPDGYMYADMSAPPRLRQFQSGYYPQ